MHLLRLLFRQTRVNIRLAGFVTEFVSRDGTFLEVLRRIVATRAIGPAVCD